MFFRYAGVTCCLNVKAKGMGLLIKALLGALVVVLIGVLSKTKNYYIAGLIPLFPTFALIAHYIVASERGIEALRTTIVFGMWSIIPYFIYLLSLWYFTATMRLPYALAGAVVCWSLCAWLLILGWSRFH
jgi:uncharacterized membrane protein (GlpM family)